MRKQRLVYVTAPASPNQSPEIQLLIAMIQSAASDRWGIWLSAIRRVEATAAGDLSHRELLAKSPPEIRATMAQSNALEAVLGWFEVRGHQELDFHPGIAGLTEQECRAWWLKAGGFSERQIGEYMDGKTRRTRQFGISLATVNRHIDNGRRKLTVCFGAAA